MNVERTLKEIKPANLINRFSDFRFRWGERTREPSASFNR
jgi:hypothetical protein